MERLRSTPLLKQRLAIGFREPACVLFLNQNPF
jgi:hypothetical protein